jgi:hypothetical protein
MRRIIYAWLMLCAALVASSACFAQLLTTGAGRFAPSGGATLSLDGSCVNASYATPTCSITTARTNDLLIVVATNDTNGAAWSACSGGGCPGTSTLSWTINPSPSPSCSGSSCAGGGQWAVSASALSSLSVTGANGGANNNVVVFAVNGAHTAAPFDGSPAVATGNGPVSITATNANDMIFACDANATSPDSGWTQIQLGTFTFCEYKIVSAPGTYTAFAGQTGDIFVYGAIKPGP